MAWSDEYVENERRFYEGYYGQLKGAKITGVKLRPNEDTPGMDSHFWPVLEVTLADGFKTELEVSQDAEGNGPGFLFGLDDDKAREAASEGDDR